MRSRQIAKRATAAALLTSALACVAPAWALHWPTVHWPWKHRPAAAQQPVQELSISTAESSTAPIAQYWDRNTLLLDLTAMSREGQATIAPTPGNAWPVRLEFRVRPATIRRLEVTGAQRLIFSVPTDSDAVVLKLDPGVYQADTAQLTLHWSAAADSAR